MSKELVTQVMRQICDGCKKTKEWDLVGADQNPTILQEMQEWFDVGRKVVVNGQMLQLSAHACSVPCVSIVAVNLMAPPQTQEDDQPDKINLADLRVSDLSN